MSEKAGMEIKDIKQFMDWCVEGPSTYSKRRAMFETQKVHVEAEIERMNRTLDMLKFKCWYYEQAIKDGSEDTIPAMIPDHLPEDIRSAYENSHTDRPVADLPKEKPSKETLRGFLVYPT